jgi:type I restriction enzyme, R subunit
VTTDTSEKGLEALIVAAMTGSQPATPAPGGVAKEAPAPSQPQVAAALDLDHDSPIRRKFLARLQGEISKRGVIDVLRKGVQHGPHAIELFYGTPSAGNLKAVKRFAANRFSVTRQLGYSLDETQRALDLCLFVNGLPVATLELKNNLTKQALDDAIERISPPRSPRTPPTATQSPIRIARMRGWRWTARSGK